MFVVVGARDFRPEITVLPIGTEVPCSDRVPRQIPICRAGVGFFQNVADISIACKIFGTRVCILQAESRIFIDFSCAQAHIMEYEQT